MQGERASDKDEAAAVEPATASPLYPPVPRWAWVLACGLGILSALVLAFGRGGGWVSLGAALGLAAVASLLLSVPDGDPADDD